jgi:hypothetical protein
MGKKLEKLQKNLENIQTTFGKQNMTSQNINSKEKGKK